MAGHLCHSRPHAEEAGPNLELDGRLSQILQRLHHGEEAALAELFESAHPKLLRYAQFLLSDPYQAEEVAADVFRQVWSKPTAYDPTRASAFSWLLMLTRSRAIDLIRSQKRWRERQNQNLEIKEIPCRSETPEQRLLQGCRDRTLSRILEILQPAQRRLLQLAFFDGRTHREIAELTGLPLGTVKTRIRCALHNLRRHCGDNSLLARD